jgi:hypothetical protein
MFQPPVGGRRQLEGLCGQLEGLRGSYVEPFDARRSRAMGERSGEPRDGRRGFGDRGDPDRRRTPTPGKGCGVVNAAGSSRSGGCPSPPTGGRARQYAGGVNRRGWFDDSISILSQRICLK